MIDRIRRDPHLGGARVVGATPLMRADVLTAVTAEVFGAPAARLILGMVSGYTARAATRSFVAVCVPEFAEICRQGLDA